METEYNLVRKSDSFIMRMLGKVFGERFMEYFWTTIGRTIYVPTRHDNELDWGKRAFRIRHRAVLRHERVHVEQFKKFTIFGMALLYAGPSPFLLLTVPFFGLYTLIPALVLLPLTVGLAWGRWYVEREAFLTQVHDLKSASWASELLWDSYLLCWPVQWSVNWFASKLRL